MSADFHARLKSSAEQINGRLDAILSSQICDGEINRPEALLAAMRHGLLNGGKRLRPFLVLETAALFEVPVEHAMPTTCALECLHSYSLIHDDLPAMDDDDLRRGQPTVHKAFDEATAILAGDALLTLSFDLVTDSKGHPDPSVRAELANLLARASGMGGMIGGQILDIAAETSDPDEQEIRRLQAMKTGALIRFACEAGAVLGGASDKNRKDLTRFGETIGLAFQLADDLLDVTSNAEVMGKAVGKDADRGKGTLVDLYGVAKVREVLDETVDQAHACLSDFGDTADILKQTAKFVANRSK